MKNNYAHSNAKLSKKYSFLGKPAQALHLGQTEIKAA